MVSGIEFNVYSYQFHANKTAATYNKQSKANTELFASVLHAASVAEL